MRPTLPITRGTAEEPKLTGDPRFPIPLVDGLETSLLFWIAGSPLPPASHIAQAAISGRTGFVSLQSIRSSTDLFFSIVTPQDGLEAEKSLPTLKVGCIALRMGEKLGVTAHSTSTFLSEKFFFAALAKDGPQGEISTRTLAAFTTVKMAVKTGRST